MATTTVTTAKNKCDRAPLRDRQGRDIEYIRVSLWDRCNYACPFCMPGKADAAPGPERRLSTAETLRLCRIFAGLGVFNFKITGGEPLLHPDALPILENLKTAPGVRCVTVTTNGSTLDRHAEPLAALGIDGVNISLNAATPATYHKVTRGKLELADILANIAFAKRCGLNVKVNMVPMLGVNDDDIVPILEFALGLDISVRFIELMPIGQGRNYVGVPEAEVKRRIEARFGKVELAAGRFGNGPAVYYRLPGQTAKVGYIAAVSERFCAACNRIRLSSTGFLKTCLHHSHGVELGPALWNGADDDALADMIRRAVAAKPVGHEFHREAGEELETVPMYRIGG